MLLYHKWTSVSGCNNEVAAFLSDHYTEVSLYYFYGPKPYIDKLREVIDPLKTSGLV